jgi:acyl-CoA thioesterase-1
VTVDTSHNGPAYPSVTDGNLGPEFTPSTSFVVDDDGRRDIGLCFVGGSLTNGYGDPKALGWVGRVMARTQHPEADFTSYNLGVRGQDSGDVVARWRAECMPRWSGRGERRLVLSVGGNDIQRGLSTARSRLNLANVLDEAASSGISTFVVGLPPTSDPDLNSRIEVLAQAHADVCSRRGVPYVDCYRPLAAHDQWIGELAVGDGVHPGQVGYGLIAWLVLHNGWANWLRIG